MTKTDFLATAVLILLTLSGCSQDSYWPGTGGSEQRPATATGVTVFGDARLGVVIN